METRPYSIPLFLVMLLFRQACKIWVVLFVLLLSCQFLHKFPIQMFYYLFILFVSLFQCYILAYTFLQNLKKFIHLQFYI